MTRRTNPSDRDPREYPDDEDAQYQVGYRKPPVAHRFQKGQSGNPSGSKRKRGASRQTKSLKSDLLDELAQTIAVTEGGRRRQVPRQKALIKKLIADALNGDAKARAQLFQLASKAEANPEAAESEDLIGAAKDAEILQRFRDEIIRKHREANND